MAADYEKKIEDAFLAVLADNANLATYPKRRWRDASRKRTFPIILAHCSGVDAEAETPTGELFAASVEVAAQTYSPVDSDRSVLDAMAAEIRESLLKSTLVNELNAKAGINLFIAVIGSKSNYESDASNINTWQTTFECHIYSV